MHQSASSGLKVGPAHRSRTVCRSAGRASLARCTRSAPAVCTPRGRTRRCKRAARTATRGNRPRTRTCRARAYPMWVIKRIRMPVRATKGFGCRTGAGVGIGDAVQGCVMRDRDV
eukprot:86963-Prorocentrum_minimum.AAC.2